MQLIKKINLNFPCKIYLAYIYCIFYKTMNKKLHIIFSKTSKGVSNFKETLIKRLDKENGILFY